nr:MAG TPA: Protein of unknown function (DUF1642) [Caudoviricetes sp.]
MNKQELIEQIKGLKSVFGNKTKYIEKNTAIELVSRLDEPQKVTIPQFVADVIEDAREHSSELEQAFQYVWWSESDEFTEWYRKKSNRDVFARAWLDGYEVEKEPKYTVKFKATNQYLCDDYGIGLHISPSFRSNFRKSDLEKLSLTEVFDNPLFEVEEVTE